MAKSGAAEFRVFINAFYDFEAPEIKKSTARCECGFRSCLRNRRLHLPSWSKSHLDKLGFGLAPDSTIIGSLNLNMMSKIEFKK
jgi:hypothetical protein